MKQALSVKMNHRESTAKINYLVIDRAVNCRKVGKQLRKFLQECHGSDVEGNVDAAEQEGECGDRMECNEYASMECNGEASVECNGDDVVNSGDDNVESNGDAGVVGEEACCEMGMQEEQDFTVNQYLEDEPALVEKQKTLIGALRIILPVKRKHVNIFFNQKLQCRENDF